MTICIVGWYGTETMGDRAILDGTVSTIARIDENAEIILGSLYPFYTMRTLREEKETFAANAKNVKISLFNLFNKAERNEAVAKSDAVIIAGGPLMDLEELFLLESCFDDAIKRGIPRIIMGCGIGPLNKSDYIKLVSRLFAKATTVALRDRFSLETFSTLSTGEAEVLGDPAIISIEQYIKAKGMQTGNRDKYASVNLREYSENEYGKYEILNINNLCENLINLTSSCESIYLTAMHTFAIGGDDRKYLSKIKKLLEAEVKKEVRLINKPMNLYELYEHFEKAELCVGMRYHSILMQTLLNGSNYIIEYTDPAKGKIAGFVDWVNGVSFYKNRRLSLRKDDSQKSLFDIKGGHFEMPEDSFNMQKYKDWLSMSLK